MLSKALRYTAMLLNLTHSISQAVELILVRKLLCIPVSWSREDWRGKGCEPRSGPLGPSASEFNHYATEPLKHVIL